MDKDAPFPIHMVQPDLLDLVPSAMPVEAIRNDFMCDMITPQGDGYGFINGF